MTSRRRTIRILLAADPATVREHKSYLWGIARKQVLKFIERRHILGAFDSKPVSRRTCQYETQRKGRTP